MSTRSRIFTGAAWTAAALVLSGIGVAEAGPKKTQRDVELLRPADAPDADAAGVLRIKTTKRGRKGVLKLRNLDPRTRYEVHDADTDEVLGVVRTNKRGKARMKIHRKVRGASKGPRFDLPDEIEICRLDDDAPLLRGTTEEWTPPEPGDLPAFGFQHYEGRDGANAFVDMFSFPGEAMEGFHLSLSLRPTERGVRGEQYEYARDTFANDELPLGVDSVAELAGRAFRVVGPADVVYVRGVLPDLERPRWRSPPIEERPPVDFPEWPGEGEYPFFGRGDRDTAAKWGGANHGGRGFEIEMPAFGDLPSFDDLPDLDDLLRVLPPDFLPFPMPEREPSRLRLEIADDEGTLTDCGHLDRIVFPEIDWEDFEWPWCPVGHEREGGETDERPTDERPSDRGNDAATR